ncbi:ABC transporter ATP-binding protein [Kaistia sp. MMO-174]|uniref:ABC transporter ATP-binding protein n=1 Tax=Kaistia sp. MMO-174 TaxID=3081256 RepID=UPI0030191E46
MTPAPFQRAAAADAPPSQPDTDGGPLLRIRDLAVEYAARGRRFAALRGASLDVRQGEVVALVGESGSGKSTIALAAMGMLPEAARIVGGSIELAGRELLALGERELNRIRGLEVGWIPQDPMVALNPLHRVGRQVAEPLRIHKLVASGALDEAVVALLHRVRIADPEIRAHQFPHELSGGMRQRVLIAGAIGPQPGLIIADEPTTALDVTVQKTILDDIGALVASSGMAMLLITHDLAMAADRADRVIVLKEGRIVEEGNAADVLRAPKADYTRMLIASAPNVAAGRRRSSAAAGDASAATATEPILALRNVSRSFTVATGRSEGHVVQAVAEVSLHIGRGETLALVGESGSGKSTAARLALGLTRPDSGSVLFEGNDIGSFDRKGLRGMRRLVQPIYQNPYASLSPRLTVAEIVEEPLQGFRLGDRAWRRRRVWELVDQVGLASPLLHRYPAELSGGQRQRVAIARALAPAPALLVCDEPVSALDVSIQAQILELLERLQATHGLSYLFISHDLAVVRQIADRVAVMKDGRIVEVGPADAVFEAPEHDYTRLLLASIPGNLSRNAS